MHKEHLKEIFMYHADIGKHKDTAWDYIEASYEQKSRHYHNLDHIYGVIHHLESLYVGDSESIMAAFYHDVVYNPLSIKCEEDSVDIFFKFFQNSKMDLFKVRRLILATKNHESQVKDEQLFIDADFYILAREGSEYMNYRKGIRREYGMYNDTEYIPARIQILKEFLARERIFYHPIIEETEIIARRNIQREILNLNQENSWTQNGIVLSY